jgi:uncharacterized protein
MKILFDIGHPAHVHYFKNVIAIISSKGHQFKIVARDKDVTFSLLDYYGLKYESRGAGAKTLLGKFLYLLKANYYIYKVSRAFKPDLFVSFGSPYAAQVSTLLGKPHLAFDDTEHATLEHAMYVPFTNLILTPDCFYKSLGEKHFLFPGCMELSYLHPKYFIPSDTILDRLGLEKAERYVLLRFVSWNASHDIGQEGINYKIKQDLVRELSKHCRVFISSESELPKDLAKYQIQTPPELMHDVLASASLYIGEGGTMATECAVLGTPAIFVNSLSMGYIKSLEKAKLLYSIEPEAVIGKALELIQNTESNREHQLRKEKMLSEKIDVTSFMVWVIENYPVSAQSLKDESTIVNTFK